MFVPFAAVFVLFMTCQSPQSDRALAEQLARSGQTVEALAVFERIVAQNPKDFEVRLWIARLQLRMGRTEEAEAGFRAVLLEHPSDVDARVGLGVALTRRDAWREALTVLLDAEKDAEVFAALARAYRRSGDDRRALEYFRRAMAVAPGDPDVIDGYEATLRAYGSSIGVEGLVEGGASDARSVTFAGAVRVQPRLLIEGSARVQRRNGSSDTLGGGGVIWRVNRSTNLAVRGAGGSGNTSLANGDVMAEARQYRGPFELGGSVRHLSFSGADVTAVSPLLGWDEGERWRFDARYTYSGTSFRATGESSGDNSVVLRQTFRGWRRVDVCVRH
jgi:tetratricopeptide (TPR) repeat protein